MRQPYTLVEYFDISYKVRRSNTIYKTAIDYWSDDECEFTPDDCDVLKFEQDIIEQSQDINSRIGPAICQNGKWCFPPKSTNDYAYIVAVYGYDINNVEKKITSLTYLDGPDETDQHYEQNCQSEDDIMIVSAVLRKRVEFR